MPLVFALGDGVGVNLAAVAVGMSAITTTGHLRSIIFFSNGVVISLSSARIEPVSAHRREDLGKSSGDLQRVPKATTCRFKRDGSRTSSSPTYFASCRDYGLSLVGHRVMDSLDSGSSLVPWGKRWNESIKTGS